jgi:hypothetical protein
MSKELELIKNLDKQIKNLKACIDTSLTIQVKKLSEYKRIFKKLYEENQRKAKLIEELKKR